MKRKKLELNKKLWLNKETVVDLSQMQVVTGGATAKCATVECPTPATVCFICPPLSVKKTCATNNTECPTEMTFCFVCPPLTQNCQ